MRSRLSPKAWIAGLTSIVVICSLAGCSPTTSSESPDFAPPTFARPAGVPTVAGATQLDQEVAKGAETLSVAGSTVPLSLDASGRLDVTFVDNRAQSVEVQNSQHETLAMAIAMPIRGTSSVPVPVDYESTVFAQMMLTPGLSTTDPLTLIFLRERANSSKAFKSLAQAYKAHAAKDPGYLDKPTQDEAKLFSEMVQDVFGGGHTQSEKPQAFGPPSGTFKSAVFVKTESSEPCDDGTVTSSTAAKESGICLKFDPSASRLTVTNQHGLWTALYSESEYLGVSPPVSFEFPGFEEWLVDGVTDAGGWVACQVGELFGSKCKDPTYWKKLADDTKFYEPTETKLSLSSAQVTKDIYGITPGQKSVVEDGFPNLKTEDRNLSRSSMLFLTYITQFILPTVALAYGGVSDLTGASGNTKAVSKLISDASKNATIIAALSNLSTGSGARQGAEQVGVLVQAISEDYEVSQDIAQVFLPEASRAGTEVAGDVMKAALKRVGKSGKGWIKVIMAIPEAVSTVGTDIITIADLGNLSSGGIWHVAQGPDPSIPSGMTKISLTFDGAGCEGCTISAVTGHWGKYQSHKDELIARGTVANNALTLLVPTDQTHGMSFVYADYEPIMNIEKPQMGGAIHAVVLGAGGVAVGQPLPEEFPTPVAPQICWAGTSSSKVSIPLTSKIVLLQGKYKDFAVRAKVAQATQPRSQVQTLESTGPSIFATQDLLGC
jgi:hypothetical protein